MQVRTGASSRRCTIAANFRRPCEIFRTRHGRRLPSLSRWETTEDSSSSPKFTGARTADSCTVRARRWSLAVMTTMARSCGAPWTGCVRRRLREASARIEGASRSKRGYVDLCNHSQSNRGLFLPGSVYSHFLRLHDGRLLLTWTHRTPKYDQDGYGGGTRALVSYDDGDTFDVAHDYIVLSAQNDSLNAFCVNGCGCRDGYGNTIQLPNGTLVSVYCHDGPSKATPAHRNAVVGVVRWSLPKSLKTDEPGTTIAKGLSVELGEYELEVVCDQSRAAVITLSVSGPAPAHKQDDDDTNANTSLWFSFYDLYLDPAKYGNCSSTASKDPPCPDFPLAASFVNLPTVDASDNAQIDFRAHQWAVLGGSEAALWRVPSMGLWKRPSKHGGCIDSHCKTVVSGLVENWETKLRTGIDRSSQRLIRRRAPRRVRSSSWVTRSSAPVSRLSTSRAWRVASSRISAPGRGFTRMKTPCLSR
eukprot:SAG11_NODE_83_length_17378_cov_5.388622_13_plen_474_part_00